MAAEQDLREMAMAIAGTIEQRHFDRSAFKIKRIYVTVAADGLTANFRFSPEEQEFQCGLRPDVFSPVPNAWGRQGWTCGKLAPLSKQELQRSLEIAAAGAVGKARR